MLTRRSGLFFAAGMTLLLGFTSGCGSGESTVGVGREFALATRTRALQAGDSWTYQSTGDNVDTSTATVTVQISASTFYGSPVLLRTTREDGDNGTGYGIEYLTQTDSRDLIAVGALGMEGSAAPPDSPFRELTPLITPQQIVFGEWAVGKQLSYSLQYEGTLAPTRAQKLEVIGTEKIRTQLGTFDTWKVKGTLNPEARPYLREGTYWYAPQIGAIVKQQETLSGFEVSGTVTQTLTGTNVPL